VVDMGKMKWYDWTAIVLLIVGGLNWGLVGIFGWNLVEAIFGVGVLTKIVYGLVGVSALFSIWSLYKANN
jgi:uncharacterized membrane protein YuzA (DUF378 family)